MAPVAEPHAVLANPVLARPGEAPLHRRSRRRHTELAVVWAVRVGVAIAVLGAMTWLNHREGDLVMPQPLDVARALRRMIADGTMWDSLLESLKVFAAGYGLAALSGIALGVLLGGFPLLGRAIEPYVHALNATPRVAFIPFLMVWLGLFDRSKIAVVWLTSVLPIMINAQSGVEAADSDLTEMARSFGARKRSLFWRVWIPGAVPSILTGLRIGSSLAILGTVVAELYLAQSGLGGMLRQSASRFRMADYFAVVVVLMAVGITTTWLLRLLERRFLVWRASATGAGS